MTNNIKCGNHGGYNTAVRNVVCGLDEMKVCAGYNSSCKSFIAVFPEKKNSGSKER